MSGTTITFELSKPLTYANGSGDPIECNHIDLVEPTGKVSSVCCAIEGIIQSGALKMASVLSDTVVAEAKETAEMKTPEPVENKDGDAMLALMMGGGCDMAVLVGHFRTLFKEVAVMGGEKQITSIRMDSMSHTDFRKMMGVYAANFILS